jgi:hypothetical protein
VRPYVVLTIAVAAAALLVSLLAGGYRRGALVGSTTASLTAIASLAAMAAVSRSGKNSVNGPLAVVVAAFLVRLVLVSLGCILVVRAGDSVVAFVVAFFIPFFAFSAIEAAFVHSRRHSQRTCA